MASKLERESWGYQMNSECPSPVKGKIKLSFEFEVDLEGDNLIERIKEDAYKKVLDAVSGNLAQTSRVCGISRRSMLNQVNKYKLREEHCSPWANEAKEETDRLRLEKQKREEQKRKSTGN